MAVEWISREEWEALLDEGRFAMGEKRAEANRRIRSPGLKVRGIDDLPARHKRALGEMME